jgi:hypothetical protein
MPKEDDCKPMVTDCSEKRDRTVSRAMLLPITPDGFTLPDYGNNGVKCRLHANA